MLLVQGGPRSVPFCGSRGSGTKSKRIPEKFKDAIIAKLAAGAAEFYDLAYQNALTAGVFSEASTY